jgi:hypothetical protein
MILQRPYKCTVHIALPNNIYAQHLKDVISVDQEISNKVVKSFTIVNNDDDGIIFGNQDDNDNDDENDSRVLIKNEDDDCNNNLRVLRM